MYIYIYILLYFLFFNNFILFIFRESGREGEKHQCVVVSHMPPTGSWPATQASALTRNPTGNLVSQANTQSTGPHQPELTSFKKRVQFKIQSEAKNYRFTVVSM